MEGFMGFQWETDIQDIRKEVDLAFHGTHKGADIYQTEKKVDNGKAVYFFQFSFEKDKLVSGIFFIYGKNTYSAVINSLEKEFGPADKIVGTNYFYSSPTTILECYDMSESAKGGVFVFTSRDYRRRDSKP